MPISKLFNILDYRMSFFFFTLIAMYIRFHDEFLLLQRKCNASLVSSFIQLLIGKVGRSCCIIGLYVALALVSGFVEGVMERGKIVPNPSQGPR